MSLNHPKRPSSPPPPSSPHQDIAAPPFVKLACYGEHKRAVSSVALAPGRLSSNTICASASADGTVKLWAVEEESSTSTSSSSGSLNPLSTFLGHSRGINHVTWSKIGHVATASDDKTCRLWDPQVGEALVEFRGHSNFVFCVKFNPSSNLLVSGSFDETVKLWDVRTGDCVSTLPAHSDPVTSVDLNRDGTCIVSGSHDGLIRVWDTATSECLKTIYAPSNPPVSHVQYSPNGKYILAGTLDSKLRLWAVPSKGQCVKTYSSSQVVNAKYCIASDFLCSKTRQCVVTGSETGDIVLYDLNSRKVHQVLGEGHKDAVLAVATHDSKELIASGGMTQDKTVKFWMPERSEGQPSKKQKGDED